MRPEYVQGFLDGLVEMCVLSTITDIYGRSSYTDSNGNEVTVAERLEDIATRYGENSEQFLTARKMAYILGLTPANINS